LNQVVHRGEWVGFPTGFLEFAFQESGICRSNSMKLNQTIEIAGLLEVREMGSKVSCYVLA